MKFKNKRKKTENQVLQLALLTIIPEQIYSIEFLDADEIKVFMPSNKTLNLTLTKKDKQTLFSFLGSNNYINFFSNFINCDNIMTYSVKEEPNNLNRMLIIYEDGSFNDYKLGKKIINNFAARLTAMHLPLMEANKNNAEAKNSKLVEN